MPVNFLDEVERQRFTQFPAEIDESDMQTYFGLTELDLAQLEKLRGDHNRLGFALQLGALRYLGHFPLELTTAPAQLVDFIAQQLALSSANLADYAKRDQTRTEHAQQIRDYLGYRDPQNSDQVRLENWLTERALEHDRPLTLLSLLADKFRAEKLVRPGISVVERMVATARQKAYAITYQKLSGVLTEDCRNWLDELLRHDQPISRTRLEWLRQEATTNSAKAILKNLKKIKFLRHSGITKWDLSELNPNRRKWLAQVGRKATPYLLKRMEPERRYPLLLAFAAQSLEDIIDETLDLFQRCLAEAYHQAKRELEAFRLNVAALTDQIVRHFQATGLLILNSDIADSELRSVLYTYLPTDKFQAAVEDCARLVRPADGTYFDYLLESYKSLHAFVPEFLANFTFEANAKAQPTLDALEVLRKGFAEGRKGISNHSTLTFVPHKWLNYVLEANGAINSRYYELCALSELRAGLRGGNIWVEGSRRYNRPEKYLIPLPKWRDLRPEVCRQTGIGVDAGAHLAQLEAELEEAMTRLEVAVGGGSTSHLRLENDRLVVSPLETELTPPGAVYLGRQCEARLPLVELVELVTEVDRWTKFSETFVHAAGAGSGIRTPEQRTYLFAAILAQACNLGPVNMARSAGLDPERLIRYTLWYLREETLGEAVVRLVNYQFGLPISRQWGNGTLSSSDGQRFPASLPNRQSAKLPKYFGYGKGLTFYTWTADNYAQYGSKPIVSTTREATYILDEILDNETELPLLEHASDTHGYTELIFGLFSLLGLKFSPRIRDVAGQQLYHMGTSQLKAHSALKPLFGGTINRWLIVSQWDELLRLAGSLKMGYVSASLLIAKLQAFPQKNAVAQALIEYGRLVKSLFILRYLESEQAQHRIETQLNKGENLHSLRKYIFYGNHGEVRKRQSEDSLNQVSCLNLVVNCCVVWNTIYMQAVIAQVRAEGIEVEESDLVHLAPARYEHVNPHGRYFFQEALAEEFTMDNLRPLRAAGYGTQVSASNLEEELGWL